MNSAQTTRATSTTASEQGQYLSFSLGGDEYAVEILRVQEILGMRPIMPVPQTPPHVKGVMNLRGTVVPVVDMRAALGLAAEEAGKFSVILVLAVLDRTIGFIVDKVSDVLSFEEATVDRTHEFGSRVASTYVAGIARNRESLVILLDVERIVEAAGQAVAPAAPVVAAPIAPAAAPVVAAPAPVAAAPVVAAPEPIAPALPADEEPTSSTGLLDALCTPTSWEAQDDDEAASEPFTADQDPDLSIPDEDAGAPLADRPLSTSPGTE